ncbi:hypothetical protein JHK85_001356 [Glycine max]|nr:hypothetical protein JHK85_001356 [Glycine max]
MQHLGGGFGSGFIPIADYGSEFRKGSSRKAVRLLYSATLPLLAIKQDRRALVSIVDAWQMEATVDAIRHRKQRERNHIQIGIWKHLGLTMCSISVVNLARNSASSNLLVKVKSNVPSNLCGLCGGQESRDWRISTLMML